MINSSCESFSSAYTFLDMKKLKIWKARKLKSNYFAINGQVISIENNEVTISCSDVLIILESVSFENNVKRNPSEIIKWKKSTRNRCFKTNPSS